MRTLQRSLFVLPLLVGATLVACSNPAPAPVAPTPPPAPPAAPPPPQAKPADPPGPTQLVVAPEIRTACGITDPEAHFAYDSSKVRGEDTPVIQKLASCFSAGPLKGHSMRLVGHADPRGEGEYNLALGGHRADSIKSALVSAKLDEKWISTTSRGELDAKGTDEAGWQSDRRVDVLLVN